MTHTTSNLYVGIELIPAGRQRHAVRNVARPSHLARALGIVLLGSMGIQLAMAATPLPPPTFATQSSPSMVNRTTTKAVNTVEDREAQRRAIKGAAKVAAGAGLILADFLNTPASPGPDFGLGVSLLTKKGAEGMAKKGARAIAEKSAARSIAEKSAARSIAEKGARSSEGDRVTRYRRVIQIAENEKTPAAIKGWLKQERDAVRRGDRTYIRNPPGYELAHQRGRESAKGYDHRYSDFLPKQLHRGLKHKIDNNGRRNREYPGQKPR